MIGFRVDANEKIATGHLMRCMAIATECKKRGEDCLFLLAEEKETFRLKEKGFSYRILHSRWDAMESEEETLYKILAKEPIRYLVVDSYQATAAYLRRLNRRVPVLYLDDMEREVYPVSAVLRYAKWPGESGYRERYAMQDTVVLEGMQYVPLREEFADGRTERERKKSILLTTGGTDPENLMESLLQRLLLEEAFLEYCFDVIVGSMNVHEDCLQAMARQTPRIRLHKNINNMEYFMRRCEMAVSAGGVTLFELCASGIPTVCFSFADNQAGFAKEAARHRIMLYAGDARDNPGMVCEILKSLRLYQTHSDMRREYVSRMKKLVDGRGAGRIAAFLCGFESYECWMGSADDVSG